MSDDLLGKVQGAQNELEEVLSHIPGYKGYKRREQRREADKLLRLEVARRYGEQLKHLGEVQYALSEKGELALLASLERAVSKLQLLIDRLRTASYGYAGLFDALKVDEEVLDRLYAFDYAMVEGADSVTVSIEALERAVEEDRDAPAQIDELLDQLTELNETFTRRQDVILG
ncbi:MAG: hypothetical protein U9R48_04765 [Chloroflexota bacterium]|nr:hypothetical protein [Chloroflexota bacterium]